MFERILQTLRWQRLSVRGRILVIVALVLTAIMVWSAFMFSALTRVATSVRSGITSTVEMNTRMQEMQLSIEQMQQIRNRLYQEFNEPSFNPASTALHDDWHEEVEGLHETLPTLETLALARVDAATRSTFNAEFRNFELSLTEVEEQFNEAFHLIEELTTRQTGALAVMDQHGDALEALILETDDPDLVQRIVAIRALENTLRNTGTMEAAAELNQEIRQIAALYEVVVPITDRSDEVAAQAAAYIESVDTVAEHLDEVELAGASLQVSLNFLRNTASRIDNIVSDETETQIADIEALSVQPRRAMLWGLVGVLLTVGLLLFIFERDLAISLRGLLATSRQFESGNFQARAAARGQDEFSQLARSFNVLAVQLQDLVANLERRVAERARDISMTGEIGEFIVGAEDPRELMNEVVERVRDRFGFYHAQVFLIDNKGENAILTASTGTVGRELLLRRHSLAVGSQSVIGQVTVTGDPVVTTDTDTSAVHRRNELLPNTRSELALPLRLGDRIIGALDVQSVSVDAFDEDNIAVLQIMADQLAMGLENARLRGQYNDAVNALTAMEQRITAEAWRAYQEARSPDAPVAYALSEAGITPAADTPPVLSQAMASGEVVLQTNGDDNSDMRLALPIKVRGEVIGAFGFGGETLQHLSEEDLILLESVMDRVGLALENLRLMDETSRRVEHEQLVNEITAKIVGSTDIDYILQTTVRELGRVLQAPQTTVQLRQETDIRDE